MSEGDIFREVEEDLRREQMAKAWDRYGAYVIAAAFIIIALAIGYNIQKWRSEERAAQGGEAFVAAVNMLDDGKQDEAREALSALAAKGQGNYATLAKLQLAAEAIRGENKQASLEHYRAVANNPASSEHFRDFAKVQIASLELDTASYDEIRSQLGTMAAGSGPFRYSAKELIALSAVRSGKPEEAEKLFGEILTDAQAPAQMRQRSEMMLSLLVKKDETAQTAAQPKGDGQNETRSQ